MLKISELLPEQLNFYSNLPHDKRSILDRHPEAFHKYFDWHHNSPLPAGTEYQSIQVYANGESVAEFEGGELVNDADCDEIKECEIWADGQLVMILCEGMTIHDLTQNAPLNIGGLK